MSQCESTFGVNVTIIFKKYADHIDWVATNKAGFYVAEGTYHGVLEGKAIAQAYAKISRLNGAGIAIWK